MESSAATLRLNIPTALTLSRVLLIPLFILTAPGNPLLGASVFAVASLTDFFDGYIARRSQKVTTFGMILDPIADKFLIISALILLVDMGRLSVWIATTLIIRDFLITALRVVALSKDIVIPAETGGKLKTAAQIISIICLVVGGEAAGIDLYDAGTVFIWAALVLSLISGVRYTVSFWKKI